VDSVIANPRDHAMLDLWAALAMAGTLLIGGDPALAGILGLSLWVSAAAVTLASLIALPLGAAVALWRFPGRGAVVVALNACMGLPPVVVGLVVYLMLSRAGPLGPLGLLFTPTAMIVAQTLLVLPLIAALARQTIETLWEEYRDQLTSLGAGRVRAIPTLLWDGRFMLATAVLAGFGRASAEVGAVMMVGGNIAGVTRTMTTSIALETGKGQLAQALALGTLLILLVAVVNAAVWALGAWARERGG
jgi:tungstate transport system permease protein